MRGEQAILNLEIKKESGLSLNPDIHHSKVFSSGKLWLFLSDHAGPFKFNQKYLNKMGDRNKKLNLKGEKGFGLGSLTIFSSYSKIILKVLKYSNFST